MTMRHSSYEVWLVAWNGSDSLRRLLQLSSHSSEEEGDNDFAMIEAFHHAYHAWRKLNTQAGQTGMTNLRWWTESRMTVDVFDKVNERWLTDEFDAHCDAQSPVASGHWHHA